MKSKSIKYLHRNLHGKTINVIAAVIVVIFIIVLVIGTIKFYHYKNYFVKGDESQINASKEIALAALQAQGKNSSEYTVEVMPQIRQMRKNDNSFNLMSVFLFNPKETQLFLIDTNTKEIVMRTETNYYNTNYPKPELRWDCRNKKDNRSGVNSSCYSSRGKGRWFHKNFVR